MSANGCWAKTIVAGPHRANPAEELYVLDCFGEELQTSAILFEKSQARAIDLAIHQQANETLVAQTGCKRQLALGYVEGRLRFAERLIMKTSHVFVRRVAHYGVVAIEIESAHLLMVE